MLFNARESMNFEDANWCGPAHQQHRGLTSNQVCERCVYACRLHVGMHAFLCVSELIHVCVYLCVCVPAMLR